ncbi:hypothetical protein [Myxococcus stipitatus]|nr:hypothetical protein [Myxococcus stipitatus]
MRLGHRLVVRDTDVSPALSVSVDCVSGLWHAWLRRDGERPVALMLVHEAHLSRASEEFEVFHGQHAAGVAVLVRALNAPALEKLPDVRAMIAAVDSETNRKLVSMAHRNEPEFVERWNRGPQTVLVHDERFVSQEPTDLSGGHGMLELGGFWARTTGLDGWSVVGLDDADLAVLVRINLSGVFDHNYLIDKRSAELAARMARMPVTSSGAPGKPYSPKQRYAVGDEVEHASFGAGRVVEVMGNKMNVLFSVGAKTLVHGR